MSEHTTKQKSRQGAARGSTGLTDKQELFAVEYAVDLNATQAAIRAGYPPAGARQQGSRMLTNVDIRAFVQELRKEAAAAAMVDAAWVRERLRENVGRAMQAEAVLDREGNETGAYVYQGTVANRALELLGKDQGMFTDRLEVSVAEAAGALAASLGKVALEFIPPERHEAFRERLEEIRKEGEKR